MSSAMLIDARNASRRDVVCFSRCVRWSDDNIASFNVRETVVVPSPPSSCPVAVVAVVDIESSTVGNVMGGDIA